MAEKKSDPPWKTIFWSAVAGVAITLVVGFWGFGWTTEGGAEAKAAQAKKDAVLEHLVPICVAQAKAASTEDLEALKDTQSWSRDDFVNDHGWSTMPGSSEPKKVIAMPCAEAILGG